MGAAIDAEPGLLIPNMLDAGTEGAFKALFAQGGDTTADHIASF